MIGFVFFLVFLLSGCSHKVFLPYEERKLCEMGAKGGYCGRLSDIYEDTLKNPQRYGIREERR